MSKNMLQVTIALFVLGLGPIAYGQCEGEPPTSACEPRVIPGTPGWHEVVMDPSTVVGAYQMACAANVGHGVWFEVTPAVTGTLTFSTCHPATTYDTVVQAWLPGASCEFPVRIDELCVEDTVIPECDNGCSYYGSIVSLRVDAGSTYLFEVGSYNDNDGGCTLCLGVTITICGDDSTPPIGGITDPGTVGCTCDPLSVIGTAYDSDGDLYAYLLEYAADGASTWTPIAFGMSPVYEDMLGVWNTAGLAQGYYMLRLIVADVCGLSSSDVQAVWVDGGFDTLEFQSPVDGAVVGGLVCLEGTAVDPWCFANYTADYWPSSGGDLQPVNPRKPVYTTPVTNGPMAQWNTTALGLPDGDYNVKVRAVTACGDARDETHGLTVDNTPPTAEITNPIDCAYVEGVVPIIGTAVDTHLDGWTLEYTGGGSTTWMTIASGEDSVVNETLADWDPTGLPFCAYTLRLTVTDKSLRNCSSEIKHRAVYTVSVSVGFCGDFDVDDDGDVDLFDYAAFMTAFTGG